MIKEIQIDLLASVIGGAEGDGQQPQQQQGGGAQSGGSGAQSGGSGGAQSGSGGGGGRGNADVPRGYPTGFQAIGRVFGIGK
jgi:hypothetical protein